LLAENIVLPSEGFLISVSGNQWYKNRIGVLRIYNEYCKQVANPLPMVLIGPEPSDSMKRVAGYMPENGKLFILVNPSNQAVNAAYSLSKALVFPSAAEGFGWPIAEAIACGCPVLTTRLAPMTEVGGDVAYYIEPVHSFSNVDDWVFDSVEILKYLLSRSDEEQVVRREMGYEYVKKFNTDVALDEYEKIYKDVVQLHSF